MRHEWHGRELHLVLSEVEIQDVIEQEQALEMDLQGLTPEDMDAVCDAITYGLQGRRVQDPEVPEIPEAPHTQAFLERRKARMEEAGRRALDAARGATTKEEARARALAVYEALAPDTADVHELILTAISERMLKEAMADGS